MVTPADSAKFAIQHWSINPKKENQAKRYTKQDTFKDIIIMLIYIILLPIKKFMVNNITCE